MKATVGLDLVTVVVKSCGSGMELHSEHKGDENCMKAQFCHPAEDAEHTSCPGPHVAGSQRDETCRRASDARIL